METLLAPPGSVPGRPHRKAGLGKQHWDDRRSQSRPVTGRICPRRSGLGWREKTVEPPQPGRAIDKRRQSLGASWSCCSKEHGRSGYSSVSPSCRWDAPSSNGSARKSPALPRFEPCEGKLSRTVLRGRGRLNRLRLPGDFHPISSRPCQAHTRSLRWTPRSRSVCISSLMGAAPVGFVVRQQYERRQINLRSESENYLG